MRSTCLALAAVFTAVVLPARAELLRARQASAMCASAGALARLGMPGGGSRNIGDHVLPAVARIARDGNCIDFPEGNVVILEKARGHTSIVRSDSLSGDGVMIEVIVANIDYVPYVPPHSVFYDTIRAQCPGMLEGIAAEDPPREAFIDSLQPPLRASIGKVLEANCGPDGNCLRHNRAAEIERRHLDARWAGFLCANPKIAIEPNDSSSGPARD